MRLRIRHSALGGALRWSQRILMTGGLLTLGYCGFVVLDSWHFQRSELRELERGLSAGREAGRGMPALPPSDAHAPLADAVIGRIEVSRVGLSAMVVEGTTASALRRAAGHISGTAMPGFRGNVGIAAHRDTFFRPLRNIRRDDIITLTTVAARYRYRVVSTKVVAPADVSVLNPTADEILTLVTCYPFYFLGSAPDRFIVRAERIA